MRTFVESLKRLYEKGEITEAQLDKMVKKKQITAEEKAYIMGADS